MASAAVNLLESLYCIGIWHVIWDGGSLKIRVNPTSTVLKGTIHLYHGYEEVSANELLTPDSLDPCTGFPTYKSIACDMEPCVE